MSLLFCFTMFTVETVLGEPISHCCRTYCGITVGQKKQYRNILEHFHQYTTPKYRYGFFSLSLFRLIHYLSSPLAVHYPLSFELTGDGHMELGVLSMQLFIILMFGLLLSFVSPKYLESSEYRTKRQTHI